MSAQHSIFNFQFSIFNSRQRRAGFTLIELLITISIIAIISAVGLVSYSQTQKIARDAKRKQDLRSIAVALELYRQKNGRYPCIDNTGRIDSSNGTNWISDQGGPGSNCPGSSTTNLAPTYINQTPTDPLNTGDYIYYYFSWYGGYGNCSQKDNFFLLAILENSSDPETLSNKTYWHCNVEFTTQNWHTKSFFVTSD